MLIHTELFSNVSGLGLEKNFVLRPRPHSFWPRPRPWPQAQLASLTFLHPIRSVLGDTRSYQVRDNRGGGGGL